ncbi:unnamed protein product [Cunninghamella blakesleeana]
MSVQATIALLNGNKSEQSLSSNTTTTSPKIRTTSNTSWGKPLPTLSNNNNNTNNHINNNINNNNSNDNNSNDNNSNNNNIGDCSKTMLEKKATRTNLDMYVEELTSMYQELLDEKKITNDTIKKLEAEVEIYSCDSTKVRDYEIRVEYLAQKLEQISEERDQLEKELSSYKDRHGSLATPHHHSIINESNEKLMNRKSQQKRNTLHQQEDEYFNEILDAYERHSENMDDIHQKYQEQIETMENAMVEYDQGMKMAMQKYVADMEAQRLQNKTLQSMVKKQEELISKLEDRLKENGDTSITTNSITDLSSSSSSSALPNNDSSIEQHDEILLRQQVELQRIELESKRDLLTQLLNEREGLLKKINGPNNNNNQSSTTRSEKSNRRSPSLRSSIDILAELAKTNSMKIPSSSSSLSLRSLPDTGRSTPPPFAAPRTPLPPLPSSTDYNSDRNSMSSHKSSANESLVSYSRSSSLPSPTSYGSNDLDQRPHHHQPQQFKHYEENFERTSSLIHASQNEQDHTHIPNSFWKRS